MAPPGSRTETPLRSVPWPWLLREAAQFPIPLFSPIVPARRAFSGQPILPARRGTSRCARAFRGSRANPRAESPAAKDSLSEIFLLCRSFSCALLQTIFPRQAPAVPSKQFSRVLFREVFLKLPEFLFPSIPSAPRFLRNQAPAARALSSLQEFPRCCLLRAFRETRNDPCPATSAAAPAAPAPRLRHWSPRAQPAAR